MLHIGPNFRVPRYLDLSDTRNAYRGAVRGARRVTGSAPSYARPAGRLSLDTATPVSQGRPTDTGKMAEPYAGTATASPDRADAPELVGRGLTSG